MNVRVADKPEENKEQMCIICTTEERKGRRYSNRHGRFSLDFFPEHADYLSQLIRWNK